MDDVEAVVPVTANEKPEKVEDTATKTENESETNGTSHDKVEGDVEVKGEEVELAVAVDNIPNEPENDDDDDDDVIIEIVPEEKADDDEDDMPALVEDVAEIKEQIIEEVVASETDTDLSALVTTSQPVVEADDSELSAAIAMINGPDEVKNTEEVVQETSDELKKTEECVAENGETETVVQEDTVADDIYADLDTDDVVNEDVHSQNVIDNLASEQMEVDGGTGDPIKSPEENYVTSPLSRDEYSDEPMDDDYYDESEDQYDDDDDDDDAHPAVQEKPKTNQKPVNDPIEIVSLDDSDEDDEDQKIQSDDRSEGDDDYEETDDESVDDEDDVMHSKRHPIRVDAKPGSSKMVFNPLAALMRVPDKKQRPVQRHYTKGQLSRMYLQRMGRRSRRWLSWRQNKIQQKSKSSSTMQIMDDSDVVECETKIPNHASPKIVKADDLSKEIKKVIAVDKEEPQPKNEENKENDKDLNENKLEEVVEDEEKLSDTVQILDESDEPVAEVVADDDEEHVVSAQSQDDEVKVDDIGSDHESDKKPQVNGEVTTVENARSPVVEKIPESSEKKDETPAINEEQARIIEELKELSTPKQEKALERPQKRPLEQTEDDEVVENPVKRLRSELENNFGQHNKILREYIEHTSSKSSAKDLEQHIAMIDSEIYTLDKMLLAKEEEWNNIIHLKKVKEEIRLRLTRKRDVLDMNVTSAFTDDHEKVTSTPISTNTSQTVMFNASSLLQNTLRSFRDAKKKESNTNNNANNAMAAANAAAAAAFAQNLNQNVTMIPLSNSSTTTSSCSSTAAHAILQNRVNTKPTDKEKSVAQKVHRNILPRPTMLPNHEQILRNLAMSSASTSEAQAAANAFTDLLNGHANSVNMGRQGPIKAVSSIIADFREKHPEQIPRRGRRMKGPHESTSRPSSADSSHSNPPTTTAAANNFKDILAQFAKMSPHERQLLSSSNSIISALNMSTQFQQAQIAAAVQASQQQHVKLSHLQGNKDTTTSINNTTKPPPYPEVTLHPVVSATSAAAAAQLNQNDQNSGSNSLLHGILTKTSNRPSATNTAAATNNAFTSGYSPTLARLLTSPERISAHQQNYQQQPSAVSNPLSTIAAGLNLSNKNSEITITPVVNSQTLQQTLLAHQQQRQKDFISMDDDNDDNSQDRLVIDEGDNQQNSYGGQDLDADVPRCQGCKKHESRFVCAGCGNQWYCSRECQVAAWDEHSEVCTG